MLATIGEGGYADGIRARLIRDRLMQDRQGDAAGHARHPARRSRAVPRALAQAAARQLPAPGSRLTAPDALSAKSSGASIDTEWTGRASPGSVGYRLVKEFRPAVRAARDDLAHRAGSRRRSRVRLHAAPARRRAGLADHHRAPAAPARSEIQDLGRRDPATRSTP